MKPETLIIVGVLAYLLWHANQATVTTAGTAAAGAPGVVGSASDTANVLLNNSRLIAMQQSPGGGSSGGRYVDRYFLPPTQGGDGRLQVNPDSQYYRYTVPSAPEKARY